MYETASQSRSRFALIYENLSPAVANPANGNMPRRSSEMNDSAYSLYYMLTSRSCFTLRGPGRNRDAVGVEVGARGMHWARRAMISKNRYAHNTEQSFWKSYTLNTGSCEATIKQLGSGASVMTTFIPNNPRISFMWALLTNWSNESSKSCREDKNV